jgi:hypothetical protein
MSTFDKAGRSTEEGSIPMILRQGMLVIIRAY